jgi:hypothetical protein
VRWSNVFYHETENQREDGPLSNDPYRIPLSLKSFLGLGCGIRGSLGQQLLILHHKQADGTWGWRGFTLSDAHVRQGTTSRDPANEPLDIEEISKILGPAPRYKGRDMFREAVPEPVWKILPVLGALESLKCSCLAGGTAPALQLGHRISADLDFFTRNDQVYPAFLDEIRALGIDATGVGRTPDHLELIVKAIRWLVFVNKSR